MAMLDLFFHRFKDAEQCCSGDDPSSQVPDCPQGISCQCLSNCLEAGNHVFITKGYKTPTWGVRTRSKVLTRSVIGPAGRLPMIELYPKLARTHPTVRKTTAMVVICSERNTSFALLVYQGSVSRQTAGQCQLGREACQRYRQGRSQGWRGRWSCQVERPLGGRTLRREVV